MVDETKVRVGYKKTEIGVIPEDWDYLKVEECVSIKTGSKNTEDRIEDGKYPFFVRSQKVEKIDTFSFDCEAVLTAGDGVGTGKVFHHINQKFDAHQRVYVMSDFKNVTGSYFFNYFSGFFYDEVCKYTAKSSVDSVRRDMIAKMMIPVPPLNEQECIANVLTDTDNLIKSIEKLIDKKKKIKQGTMQQLLTEKKRLAGFSGEWGIKKLEDLVLFQNGKAHENSIVPFGKYIVANSKFVSTEGEIKKYTNAKLCLAEKGDILLVMSDVPNGRAIAKGYYVEEDDLITVNQRVCILRALFIDSKFLFYVIDRNSYYLSFDDGVKQTNLKKEDILDLELKLPASLKEQKAIAQILSDMDAEIESLEQKLSKYRTIKQGMMQELLTGRIRLI